MRKPSPEILSVMRAMWPCIWAGGRIVHASTARTGIKYGYATYRPILTVRRIVG